MREIYKDHGRFKSQAKKLKEYLLQNQENLEKKFCSLIYEEEEFNVEKWLEEMEINSFE